MAEKQVKNKSSPRKPRAPVVVPEKVEEAPDINGRLLEALNNDHELALFFLTWIKNGRNATAAYQELHPNVTSGSARALGSIVLAKIDKRLILEALDLGAETYLKQLSEGLQAEQTISIPATGISFTIPDHKTRRPYHEALGKMHGFEGKGDGGTNVAVQVNFKAAIDKQKAQYDL